LYAPPPFINEEDGPHVEELHIKINNFKPTWRDNLFNRVEAKLKAIRTDGLEEAKIKDDQMYSEWEQSREHAQHVINRKIDSLNAIFDFLDPFDDIEESGSM
jgi:hypothetical protein